MQKIFTKSIDKKEITFEITLTKNTTKVVTVKIPKEEIEKIVKLSINNFDNFKIINQAIQENEQVFSELIVKYN